MAETTGLRKKLFTLNRGLFQFPDAYKRHPRNFEKLGQGAFGCTVKIPLRPGEEMWYENEQTIAVKYTIASESGVKLGDEDRESLISLEINDLRKLLRYDETHEFGLRIFSVTKYSVADVSVSTWTKELELMCSDLIARIIPTSRSFLYAMEMELSEDGTLSALAYSMGQQQKRLTRDSIRSIAFQIAYAMNVLKGQLRFRHFDLKSNNVLAFRVDRPLVVGFPFLLKLSDFGLSRTYRNPGPEHDAYPNWFLQPIDWMFVMGTDKLEQLIIPIEKIDLDADLWSFGLLLLQTILQGYDLKQFRHFKDDEEFPFLKEELKEPFLYSEMYIHDIVSKHKPLEDKIYEELVQEVNDIRPWTNLLPKLTLMTTISQLQRSLKNGFLPPKTLWPPGTEVNDYFEALIGSEDIIVDSCRQRIIDEDEEDEEEEEEDENPNVFDVLIEEVTKRVGEDGIEFIRRCLAWDPRDRFNFALKRGPHPLGSQLFGAALEHPFLRGFPPPNKV